MMNVKLSAKLCAWITLVLIVCSPVHAKEVMTPEKLWQVKRVSPLGLNQAKTHVLYKVTTPNIKNNDFDDKVYQVSIEHGTSQLIENYQGLLVDKNTSPDGSKKLFHEAVKLSSVLAKDRYDNLTEADAYVFDDLDYRHWDSWADGSYNHVFYQDLSTEEKVDIMPDEPFYSPLAPFGGDEDYLWGPDGEHIF